MPTLLVAGVTSMLVNICTTVTAVLLVVDRLSSSMMLTMNP